MPRKGQKELKARVAGVALHCCHATPRHGATQTSSIPKRGDRKCQFSWHVFQLAATAAENLYLSLDSLQPQHIDGFYFGREQPSQRSARYTGNAFTFIFTQQTQHWTAFSFFTVCFSNAFPFLFLLSLH